jgi:hypothetical protein
MNTLSKDQVHELTPEQQVTIATIELRRSQKRARLLKHVRQSRYYISASAASFMILYATTLYFRAPYWMQGSSFALAMAMMIQSTAINRSLDALLDLFDHDHPA